jgi:hypothetical protein
MAEWYGNIKPERWMLGRGKSLEKELEKQDADMCVQI